MAGTKSKVISDATIKPPIIRVAIGSNKMMNAHFANKLDELGRIRVDATFKMEGSDSIYAIGDCANVPEGKLGYLADKQAAALASNNPNPMMSLVPIGRSRGFVQLPFAVTSLNFLVNLKQKDLFINKTFKSLS